MPAIERYGNVSIFRLTEFGEVFATLNLKIALGDYIVLIPADEIGSEHHRAATRRLIELERDGLKRMGVVVEGIDG